jgi:hypothetical protein
VQSQKADREAIPEAQNRRDAKNEKGRIGPEDGPVGDQMEDHAEESDRNKQRAEP